jgi:Resolvase, N terminal domain
VAAVEGNTAIIREARAAKQAEKKKRHPHRQARPQHRRPRGASLKATEQPIDTGTAAGKCFLDMRGVFAKFETNLRRERQLEGIAKAKAAGVYRGRPAPIDAPQVRAMKAQRFGATEIAKALNIGRASVYGYWRRGNNRCWRQGAGVAATHNSLLSPSHRSALSAIQRSASSRVEKAPMG